MPSNDQGGTVREAGVQTRPGDVLRYAPSTNHCREGLAFVTERGVAVDTYWGPTGDRDSHVLNELELASARIIFNVEQFTALDRYSPASRETWETYHPDDRALITSQHGLQEALFVRQGAQPHRGTQINNARAAVEQAEAELSSAERTLEIRRDGLKALAFPDAP